MDRSPQGAAAPLKYALAVGLCGLTTLLALPLLGRVDLANIVLIFVLAVLLAATLLGRGPAVLASFLAVACFDFFFVPPRFSFTVAHVQYLITFAVMLAVSLVISHLTNAYRDKAAEAERRAAESALLHELASALSGALSLDDVAERLVDVLQRRLAAAATLFVPDADERLIVVRREGQHRDLVEVVTAQGVYASGQPTHANAELHDGVSTVLRPLDGSTRRRGVLALHFRHDLAPDDEALAAAIAAVVATAIERIHFVDVAQAGMLEIQTERLRSSILSAISHDLRTPLTVLYGMADSLAQSGGLSAEQQASALSLRDQSYRLHRLVDNLLDMARLKSGRIELKRDWQSIPELVGASVLALAPWLDAHRLRFDWPAELPLVELDAVLMERVFCNLLENAVKYSPPASLLRCAAAVVAGAGAPQLLVSIDNDGAGFPAERGDQVFELFARGATESTVPGVGVGLAVCRAIVEAHGGRIAASNRPGGAVVRLWLPLGVNPPLPAEIENAAAPDAAARGAESTADSAREPHHG